MGTSLTRKHTHIGPYSRPMPRVLVGSHGGGRSLRGEVPLYLVAGLGAFLMGEVPIYERFLMGEVPLYGRFLMSEVSYGQP